MRDNALGEGFDGMICFRMLLVFVGMELGVFGGWGFEGWWPSDAS